MRLRAVIRLTVTLNLAPMFPFPAQTPRLPLLPITDPLVTSDDGETTDPPAGRLHFPHHHHHYPHQKTITTTTTTTPSQPPPSQPGSSIARVPSQLPPSPHHHNYHHHNQSH
ncbi:hypothetical protein E2C01_097120 [Portunus trituberculatus]|uniref:Uncharacterized protein n=1 Tax=Portunus trituberculatus TaxID=210409 RepID=A0A5B7K3S9_PORTR|nr:hypothetical protein [Portunus trituberculatus]